MTHPLRDSLDLIRLVRPEAGTAAIEHEIAQERASSLGAAERRAVAALVALETAEDSTRPDLLAVAQKSVWEFMVQRELLGMRRHTDVIRALNIPPIVLNGLGIVRR